MRMPSRGTSPSSSPPESPPRTSRRCTRRLTPPSAPTPKPSRRRRRSRRRDGPRRSSLTPSASPVSAPRRRTCSTSRLRWRPSKCPHLFLLLQNKFVTPLFCYCLHIMEKLFVFSISTQIKRISFENNCLVHMGIHGLWPVLETSSERVSLEKLDGKRVAVDVSIWLYQAQLGFSPDSPSPHVHLLIRRLAKLIFYKIRPVFVFDGPAVPVFKRRVLEERAMKRHADELVVTKDKMKHLEDLARSEHEPEAVQKALTAMRSPQKRKRRDETEKMFELPSTSREVVTVVDSSTDDEKEEEEVEKEEGIDPRTSDCLRWDEEGLVDDVMALAARRETLRAQRLLPHQLPHDSDSFSSFQMQRLLGRSRLNERIEELKKSNDGEQVVMLSREGRKREHRIEWDKGDDECTIIEEKKKSVPQCDLPNWRMTLSLDYMEEEKRGEEDTKRRDEEEDVQRAITLSLVDRGVIPSRGEWMSKSGLIEEVQRKRHGMHRRVSSSSSDSDMIDVPSTDIDDIMADVGPSTSGWNPALIDDEIGGRVPSMITTQPKENEERERTGVAEYRELQEVLSICGFPWIEAPGEAEAQCVWLQNEGLVDAVVSDDSDCFAFGVGTIVRHMFSREKDIEYYEGRRVEKELGLTRWDTISIAMLSGGDYSMGLKGVGIVTALELLAQFTEERKGEEEKETLERLRRIEEWLMNGKMAECLERKKLRAAVERTAHRDEIKGLANASILSAYSSPLVDESREPLRWRQVKIERLKALLWQKLKWDEQRVEKTLMDAFARWNEFMARQTTYQMHISSYIVREGAGEKRRQLGKRMEAALGMIREKRAALPAHLRVNSLEEKEEEKKKKEEKKE
ncbi:hypothetical protein PFISCL1PPCAC_24850, partial [Pristionchus fissidentatus]